MARKPKIGDVFEVPLQGGQKGYVQYIGKDKTELNTDVIRVFVTHYLKHFKPEIEDVVEDNVDFYSHIMGIKFGVKDGSWVLVGHSDNVGSLNASLFRSPGDSDVRREDGVWAWPKVSKSWYLWRMNDAHLRVSKLEGENTKANPGEIAWPKSIVYRMQTGQHHGFYPAHE